MIKGHGIMDQPNQTFKQRSLLNKFEIPIDHFSFDYVKNCNDIKELERIVRILRSGEEGFYPDLQQTAEDRLRSLSPNNRLLRHDQPVLSRNNMTSDEWDTVVNDVSSWKMEIAMRELKLSEENNNGKDESASSLPPVRTATARPATSDQVAEPSAVGDGVKRKSVSDYAAWDKYDADTELLKLDLAEERRRQEQYDRDMQARKDAETERLRDVIEQAEKLSETERRVLAEQEKDRGNEYYKAKEFTEALAYYTASISICPTAKAHNNRAACYLKLCKYSAALEDVNSTLALEPNNIKALFRRGIALQHKNMFREALVDMNKVVAKEPKHVLAQHIAQELREQILSLPKTVRVIKNGKVTRVPESELLENKELYEVTERGLPKIMCTCHATGSYRRQPVRRWRPERGAKITELGPEPSTMASASVSAPASEPKITELREQPSSTKMDIVEVDKPEAIEDFFKPNKCVVVDKRTKKNVLTNGDVGEASATLNVTVTTMNGSDTDEDFELNCPLLSDSMEVEPAA